MNYPVYWQRDPRWADRRINNTTSDMGHYGCTITCLAMLFSGSDPKYTPEVMEGVLEATGAFVGDLVWWTKVANFRHRFYCEKVLAPVDEIKAELAAGRPVLLNVHLGSGNPFKANHWVLATGLGIAGQITIQDPWTGDIIDLRPRYGPEEKAILGGAYFNSFPAPVVDEFPKQVKATANLRVRKEPVITRNANGTANDDNLNGWKKNGEVFEVIARIQGEAVNGNTNWLDTKYGYVSEAFVTNP